jgi:hypothetical protein
MFGLYILRYGLMVSGVLCPAQRGGWPVRRAPTFTIVGYFPKLTQGMPVDWFILSLVW